jgi:thiamine biosynthesis lipoprotein
MTTLARTPNTLTTFTKGSLPTAAWNDWSCFVRVVVEDDSAVDAAAAQVRSLMASVSRAASRFEAESEINWANVNAGRPVAISRLMCDLVSAALDVARMTAGAVDPTIGADLLAIGYDRDISLVACLDHPTPKRRTAQRSGSDGWRLVRLDRRAGLLTMPIGRRLDLGATAKAATADWAAEQLYQRFGCGALVEIGGDLAVAGPRRDWQITVAERLGAPSDRVALRAGGMATSTTKVRHWSLDGVAMHHIIDPATGRPARGPWQTVTVAADSALTANACSTGAIVMGTDGEEFLRRQAVAARLVDRDGITSVIGGWPC